MAITVEELTARLNEEAARRGMTSAALLDELAAKLDDPVEAFIACGASGQTEALDIDAERARAAVEKVNRGI